MARVFFGNFFFCWLWSVSYIVQSSEAKGAFWNILSVDLGETSLSNARETLPSNKKKPLIFSKYFPFFSVVHIKYGIRAVTMTKNVETSVVTRMDSMEEVLTSYKENLGN